MRSLIIIMVILIALTGCATTTKMNKVSIGMTKNEVIEIMGKPESTAGIGKEETLRYNLYNVSIDMYEEYWVVLHNGKVYKYGRAGDYKND